MCKPVDDREAVEADSARRPEWPRPGRSDGDHVRIPAKSVERHSFNMRVISVCRVPAVLASLKTRSLFRFNHYQESPLVNSCPDRTGCACRCIGRRSCCRGHRDHCGALLFPQRPALPRLAGRHLAVPKGAHGHDSIGRRPLELSGPSSGRSTRRPQKRAAEAAT